MGTWAEWYLHCDAPDCRANLAGTGPTDRAAIEHALTRAIEHGWFVAADRFIRPRLDLCPAHRSKP